MLTKRQRDEVKRQHQALKDKRKAIQAEIAEHRSAIDALQAEIADLDDAEKLYTDTLKAIVDEYEKAHEQ